MRDRATFGSIVDDNIIEVDIIVVLCSILAGAKESDVATGAFVASQIAGMLIPFRRAGSLESFDGSESADIGGIGHDTHSEVMAIVAIGRRRPAHLERDLQSSEVFLKHRHGGIALDIGRVVAIEIEGLGARSADRLGIGIGRSGIDNAFGPTRIDNARRSSRRSIFKAIGIGERIDGRASSADGDGSGSALLSTTVGGQIDIVRGGGGQARQGERMGVGGNDSAIFRPSGKASGAILEIPRSGGAALVPIEGNILVGNAIHNQLVGTGARGHSDALDRHGKTIILVGSIGMELDGDGTFVGSEWAKGNGVADTGGIVAEKDRSRGTDAIIDGEIVIRALGVGGARDDERLAFGFGKEDESAIEAHRIRATDATIVGDDIATSIGEGVGAGMHSVEVASHGGDGANPKTLFAAAIGTDIEVVAHTQRQTREGVGGIRRRDDVFVSNFIDIEAHGAIGDIEIGVAVSIPSKGNGVAIGIGGGKIGRCNAVAHIDAGDVDRKALVHNRGIGMEDNGEGASV